MSTKSKLLLLGVVLFDIFLWFFVFSIFFNKNGIYYYQFDVGQGDASLLSLPGEVEIVYDFGPSGKIVEQIEKTLSPSNRRLEIAIISHPQYDHYAGLLSVLQKFDIGVLITSGRLPQENEITWKEILHLLTQKQIPHLVVEKGDKIFYQSSTLQVLWPDSHWVKSGEPNDASLVVRADLGRGSILLTGDIGGEAEKALVNNYASSLQSNILKIPHHGSKYSTSVELLKAVKPQFAVVSSGYNNRYGHPHPELLRRVNDRQIPLWRIDQKGGLKIQLVEGQIKANPFPG
ncbi:MAG: MBL fold metallo-hydrolase [Anaplasmataceae bacterium]|nr:MBL fold metallo-hydrolase [Anaplasmataceae bacterium]